MKYGIFVLLVSAALVVQSQTTTQPQGLPAPVIIGNYENLVEVEGGVILQRNDSIYQYVQVQVCTDGEVLIHVSKYFDKAEADRRILAGSWKRKPSPNPDDKE